MDDKPHYGIFRTKEQMEAYLTAEAEHERKMKIDPDYRVRYEKMMDYLRTHFPPHDED